MAVSLTAAQDAPGEPAGFLPRISLTTVERHVPEADAGSIDAHPHRQSL